METIGIATTVMLSVGMGLVAARATMSAVLALMARPAMVPSPVRVKPGSVNR